MPTDPVCGMFVPATTDLSSDVDGEEYFFCSKTCLHKFSSPEKEAKSLKKRLILGWSLSLPVILISYLTAAFALKDFILLSLTIPVQFYSGFGFYEGAYHAIKSKSGNMDLLISMGTLTAFIFSVYVTLFPAGIPGSAVYYDASAFIITLILTGNYVENLTKVKANRAANKLRGMIPNVTHYISNSGEVLDKPTEEIRVGDNILIKPGEIISVDCVIYDGSSEVDESMLTGEQEPVLRVAGNEISSGTKNLNGILRVRVTRTGRDSTVNQIFELIQRAISGRAKVQRIADAFSAVFVPIVVATALGASLFWYFYLSSTGYPLAIEIAVLAFVSVIVIACPCAIGLAGPITLLISSDVSSENGIIIKNSGALERLSKATRAVFDKTGTLTEPDPTVTKFQVEDGYLRSEVLTAAASLESSSNHPIARTIVEYARNEKIDLKDVTDVREIPGVGITGRIGGDLVDISRGKRDGGSVVSIRINGVLAGHISLSYRIRKNTKSAIIALRQMGLKTSMVTGDSVEEANRIAGELGIDDIHAEILPSEKAEIIKRYQMNGDYVVFTGDGINDTIALETADVGIAMASGTDIARESGDIILLNNDLNSVANVKIIGEKTISKVKQNIGWAIGYNCVLIPVAGGVLVPFFGLSIYAFLPILAALAMGMSSSSVVLNSLRLRGEITRLISDASHPA
ncbi:MAG: heavy metal translocating P-type ATPase [Thermoplasmataceae archaeon]